MHILGEVRYEWDSKKATSNLRRHKVRFSDATGVFSDEYAITVPDADAEEERYITLGMDSLLRIVVVVFTWRKDKIRIISARKATRTERKEYVKGL